MNTLKKISTLFLYLIAGTIATGQGIPIGETILVSTSQLKKSADPEAFKNFMSEELIPTWNKKSPGPIMYLLQADRGDRNGEFLTICMAVNPVERKKLKSGSPFSDKAISGVAGT